MSAVEPQELVFVQMSGNAYALVASDVSEVLHMLEPMPMPGWPEEALGVINLRGDLIPLLDAGPALGRGATAISPQQFILIVHSQGRRWGLVADKVDGVRSASIRLNSAPRDPKDRLVLCRGMALDSGGPVVLLEIDALVRSVEIPEHSLPGGAA